MSAISLDASMNIIRSLRLRISDLWQVCLREFRHIFADSGAILFFLVVPFAYPFLYSALYGSEVVREAPLVVIDKSHTAHSREFIRRVDASPDVRVVAYVAGESEALPPRSGRSVPTASLIIPEDFDRMLMSGRQAHVDLHATFVSALYYKAFSLATTEVALTMGAKSKRSATTALQRSHTHLHPPYRERMGRTLQPARGLPRLPPAWGAWCSSLQQTLLIGISMMSGTQRERGGLSTPVQYVGGHYVSVMRLLVGRAICYFTLYSVTSLFTLVVAPWLFGLPQLTDFTTYVLLFLPMILAMIFFSLGCSLLTRHREKAMILWVFTSVPFLFLTGLSWPLSAIPGPLRALGYLIPSTPGVQAFVAVSSMGAQLSDILPQYLTLWVQALVYFLITSFAYARVLRRS